MNTHTLKSEYDKLDVIDRKVLNWTVKHAPSSLSSWIEYTAKSYHSLKGIKINAQTLFNEVKSDKPEI